MRGWVQHHRSKGKLQFVVMRDGTGVCQLVAFKGDLAAGDLGGRGPPEPGIVVRRHRPVRPDERAPGGFELGLQHHPCLPVRGGLSRSAEKEHGVGFLMENRHLWLRSTRQQAALKVRAG